MTRPTDDEARWGAVVSRQATADESFVYGVVTTGVFCRPSWPSIEGQDDVTARAEMLLTTPPEYVAAFFRLFSGGETDETTVHPPSSR